MTETRLPASTVGGYRLVRRLGGGSRSDVYLGIVPGGDALHDLTAASAAIKIFHPHVARHSIALELAALGRSSSAHSVRLLDVAEDDTGTPVAVLSRVMAGSVAGVLAGRGTVGMGEAVTILAPVAGLLAELHAGGVAHGGLSAATVHFSDAGEPVLLGFGHAHLFAPNSAPAVLEQIDAVMGDRERLALFAEFVLERVEAPGDAEPLRRWLDALARPLTAGFAVELEQRLFDRAGATAVLLVTPGGHNRDGGTGRPSLTLRDNGVIGHGSRSSAGIGHGSGSGSGAGAGTGSRVSRRPASLAITGSRDWVTVALGGRPLSALRERVAAGLRTVRRPVWIVAVLVAGAVAIVVPLAGSLSLAETGATGGTEVGSSDGGSTGADDTGAGDTGAEGQGDAADPSAAANPTGLPDDPVEALPLLLTERTRCIADLSVLCLEAVDQGGSTALADDRALIEAMIAGTAGEFRNVEGTAPALVERLGDSALLTVGEQSNPASVLMIRTEAGWRVREIRAP